MSIAITGASGKLARKTADFLLERLDPHQLVLITRSPDALAAYAQRGVHVRSGDFDQPGGLPAAMEGVDRLLLISASDIGRRVGQHLAAIEAARAAGVRHVAYTSVLDPRANTSAVGPDHAATEQALLESGLEWTFLRNAYYADQSVAAILAAVPSGRHLHNAGDGVSAYVAREDCAAVAAAVLATDGHAGQAYDVTGPELLSTDEMVEVVSRLVASPLEAVAVDDDTFIAGLVQHAGMPAAVAQTIASFGRSVREGTVAQRSDVVEQLTGRPAIRFEELVSAAMPAIA